MLRLAWRNLLPLALREGRGVAAAASASVAPVAAACFCTLRATAASAVSPARSSLTAPLPATLSSSPPSRGLKRKSFSAVRLGGSASDRRSRGEVEVPEFVSADHLAHLLRTPLAALAKRAVKLFPQWWPHQTERQMKKEAYATAKAMVLRFDDAQILAQEFKRTAVRKDLSDSEWVASAPAPSPSVRPAVVAVMGHKDHGKTTLLDRLRNANVAAREEFGITQDTYAFNVLVQAPKGVDVGQLVTVQRDAAAAGAAASSAGTSSNSSGRPLVPFSFLDTPGHVSFGEMRATVGSLCDLILLVVAADEGVLDQTFESLRLARQLDRPLVVAISKMDLPGAREKADRIRRELQDLGATIHPPHKPKVSNKGDLVVVELSALKGGARALEDLQKALVLVAQQLPLDFDAGARPPRGLVVESTVAPGRGGVVRMVLQQGSLRVGDHFVAEGVFEGRVKDLRAVEGEVEGLPAQVATPADDGHHASSNHVDGVPLASVGAGVTVDVVGCVALPNPGAEFVVVSSKEQAHLMALVARNRLQFQDQLAERADEDEQHQGELEAEEAGRLVRKPLPAEEVASRRRGDHLPPGHSRKGREKAPSFEDAYDIEEGAMDAFEDVGMGSEDNLDDFDEVEEVDDERLIAAQEAERQQELMQKQRTEAANKATGSASSSSTQQRQSPAAGAKASTLPEVEVIDRHPAAREEVPLRSTSGSVGAGMGFGKRPVLEIARDEAALDEELEEEDEELGDDEAIDPNDVPVDLDPRARLAPPLPPRGEWELSPPPPPASRAMPLSQLRPQFKFYNLQADFATEEQAESAARNAAVQVEAPPLAESSAPRRFGLTVLLKAPSMGALRMLRASIEDMNGANLRRGLPEIHVALAAVGELTKRDLVNAEAEGCWVYLFRAGKKPAKPLMAHARGRAVPLLAFRHHQHLLDHLQKHIEHSPVLTRSGEAADVLRRGGGGGRRSHPSVQ